jgi:hypothetical protein
MRTSPILFLAASCAVACSSSKSSSSPQGDAGAAANTITFSMHETVPASSEIFGCMYVQPSIDRTYFTKIEHTYTPGSHHLVLFQTDLTAIPAGGDQPHDCYAGGADFMSHVRGVDYASQVPADSFEMPKGVAFFSDPNAVYLLQTHYLNATASALDATATVTLTTSDGSDVGIKAGVFTFYDPYIEVPMGGMASAGMRCAVPQDATMIRVIPHTHARGTTYSAFLDPPSGAPAAQPFYTSSDWEHPSASPPAMQVPAGSHIRFKCDYANTTGTQAYYQGQSALTNEMCVFFGIYYPDQGNLVNGCPNPDQLGLGTATCEGTASCLDPCYALTDQMAIGHCVQSCVVKSCPSAGATLQPYFKCGGAAASGNGACVDACKPGSTGCLACVRTACPMEETACQAATTCP